MNKEKEFANNTIILLIGKFSTQFVSLLLIPLYTNFLNTEDYGIIDLLQTYITLFVPILTLKLDSAVFRFLIDARKDEESKRKIITNVITFLSISLLLCSMVCLWVNNIIVIRYKTIVLLNILVLMTSNVFLQILRGLGENKSYTISSIITSIINLIINFILILGFKYNASSILIASTIANFGTILYVFYKVKLFKLLKIRLISKKVLKELLKYSIPMIPNQLSWWIVNVSDRTLITYFAGSALNAIYAISCKFSNIINTVFSIFNISWQETASLHTNDEDRNEFLSNMINKLFILFSTISILLIALLPIVFSVVVGESYKDAYNYIPILILSNIFYILISLIGGIYVALKKVKQIANTTILSAIINIIINILFMKKFLLYAASMSTLVAYITLFLYRYYDVNKYVKIKLEHKKVMLIFIIFICTNIAYFLKNNILIWIVCFIDCVLAILFNKEIIRYIFKILKNRLNLFKV